MDNLAQIFGDVVQGYQAYSGQKTAQAQAPVQTAQAQAQKSANWTTIALIGGGVLALVLVLVFAFRK